MWVSNGTSLLNLQNFCFKIKVKNNKQTNADTKAPNYYFSEVYKPLFWKDHPLILSTHCHSEELNLVFVDSRQGIPGGKKIFVFDGASVCIHSCLTSVLHKKRSWKPFEKKLDYREHAVILPQQLQHENTESYLFPNSLLIFNWPHCTKNCSSFILNIATLKYWV